MRPFIANILILFGVACLLLASYYLWQRTNPQRLSFDRTPQSVSFTKTPTETVQPIQIIIPALNINLPIYPAEIKNNKWEATTKGVSYLTSSPIPGEKGNSILYGHNWPNILGNLVKAQVGQEIQIIFADQTSKTFVIKNIAIVKPNETQVLSQTDDQRITLYTCTGFLDRKRFVAIAL